MGDPNVEKALGVNVPNGFVNVTLPLLFTYNCVTVVPKRFDATGAIYIKAYQSRRSIIVPRECIRGTPKFTTAPA